MIGSRALSILPICRAIRVLPVPGGPYSKMPAIVARKDIPSKDIQTERSKDGFQGMSARTDTLHVLDAELLHQRRRKDARRKRTAKDGAKFRVETANAEVFKPEVLLNKRRCGAAVPNGVS